MAKLFVCRKCIGLAIYFIIHIRILISDIMYHWVGTGEDYNPRGFHMFPTGFIHPRWGMATCVVVGENTDTGNKEWRVQDCEKTAGYVCELPLGKLSMLNCGWYMSAYPILIDGVVYQPDAKRWTLRLRLLSLSNWSNGTMYLRYVSRIRYPTAQSLYLFYFIICISFLL